MDRAGELGVGRTVLESIRATRKVVNTNTNLGIVLLSAPLAAVPRERSLLPDRHGRSCVAEVLERTTVQDAELVYQAIRLAQPGGIGSVDEQDVAGVPTETLLDVMRKAARRDRIAAEYESGFEGIIGLGLASLAFDRPDADRWEEAVVNCFLSFLCSFPDGLIQRKCGSAIADEASRRAGRLLSHRRSGTSEAAVEFEAFDRWLRADGNRRNPGTSADLTAATLFVALREGIIAPPLGPIG
jgi:triphosphoribosyl-dephospho-CoA synthase